MSGIDLRLLSVLKGMRNGEYQYNVSNLIGLPTNVELTKITLRNHLC